MVRLQADALHKADVCRTTHFMYQWWLHGSVLRTLHRNPPDKAFFRQTNLGSVIGPSLLTLKILKLSARETERLRFSPSSWSTANEIPDLHVRGHLGRLQRKLAVQ